MSLDLKSLMQRSAPDPSGGVDLEAVAGRSRGLRRRDRLITLTTTVALGLVVFVFFSLAQPNDGTSDDNNDRNQVVNPGPDDGSPRNTLTDSAATFAIQAVDEAGLRDPTDVYFDYKRIYEVRGGYASRAWLAEFSGPECTDYNRPCDLYGVLEEPTLTIELFENEFVVTEATGMLDRPGINRFARPSDQGPPHFVWNLMLDETSSGSDLTHFIASSYWTGPIPSQYYSECEAQSGTWDEQKKGVPLYADSPRDEADRDDLVNYATEQQIGRGPYEIRCDPVINLDKDRYEMPPMPEDFQLVDVGSEVIVPSEPELAPDKEKRHSNEGLPTGPRYVVAKGTFDQGEWGDYQDQEWWYLAWSDARWTCDEFEVADIESDSTGWGCTEISYTHGDDNDATTGITVDPGGKNLLSVAYGTLSTEVASLDFELSTGDLVRVDAIEPPEEMDGSRKYFVAYLPPAENGYVVSRDADGVELARDQLCHESCLSGSYDTKSH